MEKGSGSSTGQMQKHNERDQEVKNADPDKAHLNFYVSHNSELTEIQTAKENPRTGSYKDREDAVIRNQGVTRKIQQNAVRRLSFVLSGSHEQMKQIEKEGNIKKWALDNYKFIGQKYGYENITEFAVHCDELTPHIHCMIVPIVKTKEGELTKSGKQKKMGARLSARELTQRKDLVALQDEYAMAMKKYGLERGLKGSRARHETASQFYGRVNEAENLKHQVSRMPELKLDKKFMESNTNYEKRVLEKANKMLQEKAAIDEKKNKAELAKALKKTRKTFLKESYNHNSKLTAEEKLKLKKLETIDKDLERKYQKKKDIEFLKNFKTALEKNDNSRLTNLVKDWSKNDKSLER
jgi:hypothetical protein